MKQFGADGTMSDQRLVSAEWYPFPNAETTGSSIVHTAVSDEFQITLPQSQNEGEIGVWIIYADFLGAGIPPGWPREPEYDGGILAFVRLRWKRSGNNFELSAQHDVPKMSTGFDWAAWTVEGAKSAGTKPVHPIAAPSD